MAISTLLARPLARKTRRFLRRVRAFLEAEVAPVITEYWIREEFPHQLLPKLAELHIMGLPYQGYGCPGKSIGAGWHDDDGTGAGR